MEKLFGMVAVFEAFYRGILENADWELADVEDMQGFYVDLVTRKETENMTGEVMLDG